MEGAMEMDDRYFDHIVGCLKKAHEKAIEGMCSVSDDLIFRAMYLLKEQQARIERMTAEKASSPLNPETKTLEECLAEFGVKIGFLTPEKAEQLLKEHPRIVNCPECVYKKTCIHTMKTVDPDGFCKWGETVTDIYD